YTAFAAAGVFAIGICFFWPTMIGFIAENLYRTGPLGLSIMGGTGLMSTALVLPIMGSIYADQLAIAENQMQAGASTLQLVAILPAILIVCFGFLYIYMKKKKSIYSDN
ncbi:MAG: MFS transporter, partial [Parapedobacter sp.]